MKKITLLILLLLVAMWILTSRIPTLGEAIAPLRQEALSQPKIDAYRDWQNSQR